MNRTKILEIKNILQESLKNAKYTDKQEADVLAAIVLFGAGYPCPSGENSENWKKLTIGEILAYHVKQICDHYGLNPLKIASDTFQNKEILSFVLSGIEPLEGTLELYKNPNIV